VPQQRSAAPLADRLGVQAWAIDLIAALLLSVGANGLAATLIAWSASAGPAASRSSRPTPGGSDNSAQPALTIEPVQPVDQMQPKNGGPAAVAAGPLNPDTGPRNPEGVNTLPPQPVDQQTAVSSRTRGVLRLIEASGGTLTGSQRQLADQLGLPKSAMCRALSEARDAGLIQMEASKLTGTRIMVIA
jgi:MarR family